MRPVIVGTAGHIDHGKTALVRRLTGIDTDRLKEEKERGISIDLGFAHLRLPSGNRVAIVDVPGHERFVKNMLAGATGIDLVLLVVAADESVMPQTREHLAIVDLLRVRRGIVALTKADLAGADQLAVARLEVESLLEPTLLRGSPIVPVSSVTGAGIPELLETLDRAVSAVADPTEGGGRDEGGLARLPIDRVFSMEGIGTVVTGTLWSGTIRAGDPLAILPAGRAVRVRQVEVHEEGVPAAVAGQRTAVALHGVSREEVDRGDWLVTPGRFRAGEMLDVRLSLLASAWKPLPSRARVRVHLGASETLGRIVLFEGSALAPGASALAQLRLESPVVAVPGDRLVIRSYSPAFTAGGATVIDSDPVKRSRLDSEALARLAALETGGLGARLALLAREAGFAGLRPEAAALRLGVDPQAADALAGELESVRRMRDGRLLSLDAWAKALDRLIGEVRDYSGEHRLLHGIPKGELKSLLQRELPAPVFDEALEAVLERGQLSMKGDRVGLPQARPSFTADQAKALEMIEQRLRAAGFQAPDVPALFQGLPATVKPAELIRYLAEEGQIVKVTSEMLYPAERWAEIEARVRAHFTRNPTLSMAAFKDLLQVSRKYAVPILEQLDRTGLTRREGDVRVPGPRIRG